MYTSYWDLPSKRRRNKFKLGDQVNFSKQKRTFDKRFPAKRRQPLPLCFKSNYFYYYHYHHYYFYYYYYYYFYHSIPFFYVKRPCFPFHFLCCATTFPEKYEPILVLLLEWLMHFFWQPFSNQLYNHKMDRVRLHFDLHNLPRAPIPHLLGDGKRFFTRWCEIVKSRCLNQLQLRCLESFHNWVYNSINFPPFFSFLFFFFSLHQLLTHLQLKVYYEELARKSNG